MKRIATLLVAAVLAVLYALPVLAISTPDSVSISKVHATEDVLGTGDILFTAEYNIAYTSVPDENINEAFIFRLIDTDGSTELGRVLAYPLVNQGYGVGVISFYFDNSTAPGTDQYIIRVTGNPAVFGTPYTQDFTMPTSAYTAYSSDPDIDIRTQVLLYVTDLNPTYEPATGSFLAASDGTATSLTAIGEVYFTNTIPNLRNMSPSLFQVQEVAPSAAVDTYNGSQASAYESRFVGNWVADSVDAAGDLLNTDAQLAMGLVIVVLCVLWAILAAKATGTANSGFLLMANTLLAGVLLGFVSMAVATTIVFICGVYLGIGLIMRGLPG